MTFRKSTICSHQLRVAVSDHWTPLAIAPQPRGGLDCPEGLNDPLSHWLQWMSAEHAILLTPEWEECICATSTPSQRLAEEAQAQRACPSGSTILEQYKDFADIFSEEAFAHLPPHKAWDHAIDLHHNAKLPRGRTFPLSPAEQKELDEFLRENLANGCIRPSKSPIGAPVFFIKKKKGSLCLVQDYRKLNEIMVKNSYPLPLVSNMLTRLRDVEWFTTLDLRWGFNNV